MDLRQSLKEELNGNRNYDGREFIPAQTLTKLVTQQTVHDTLGRIGEDLIDRIASEAPRIFAILLLIERGYHILSFLDGRLCDEKLPIDEVNVPHFETEDDRLNFFRIQFCFPPIFEKHRHLELPEEIVLPFVEFSYVANGSFGMVYKVKVAEGHLLGSADDVVALKRVLKGENDSWQTIMREVETLRKREHPNIIPLLASFVLNGTESGYEKKSLNLIFPYAEMNLEAWMNLEQTPQHLQSWDLEGRRKYLYQSMYTLVSALSFLHRELDGMITSHHDLKPKNILILGDALKICDFGRSHLIPLAHGSETEGPRGTYTYHPPEYWNDDGSRASRRHGRAFDVWSMGCILTEMATLVVYGWSEKQQVRTYRERRLTSPRRRELSKLKEEGKEDDSFHNHIDEVHRWISELKEADGSYVLDECLRIAEAMLNPVAEDRLSSWEAELDMFELLHPDNPRVVRLEKGALCVQSPGPKASTEAQTPLHRAALRGNLDRIKQLLEVGWSADARDRSDLTPIQLAQRGGTLSIKRALLQEDKNEILAANQQFNKHGKSSAGELTILTRAIKYGSSDEVFEILTRSESPRDLLRQTDEDGLTPLHWAARFAPISIVNRFLGQVVDMETALCAEDGFGNTPLHHASECAPGGVVSLMLKCQPYNEQWFLRKGSNGRSPLHWAALRGNRSAAEELLSYAPNPSRVLAEEDDDGHTPLLLAIKHSQTELEELLRNHKRV